MSNTSKAEGKVREIYTSVDGLMSEIDKMGDEIIMFKEHLEPYTMGKDEKTIEENSPSEILNGNDSPIVQSLKNYKSRIREYRKQLSELRELVQ